MHDERKYKYFREDFGELPAHLDHLTIYLNFLNDRVEATNCLQMTARRDLESIALDACDLEIRSVEWCTGPDSAGDPLRYDYLTATKQADSLSTAQGSPTEKLFSSAP